MKLHIYISILACLYSNLNAQNLVPDPGFEIMGATPTGKSNSIFSTKHWTAPNYASSDYYNSMCSDNKAGVPKNCFGYQEAHSGNGYAGICIQNDLIEYVQSKLLKTLQKGQEYQIEFYISKAEKRSGSINEFGILFLDKVSVGFNRTGIPYKPDVDFYLAEGYKNDKEWTKLSGTYIANGTENAFIVGYFNYDSPKGYKNKAHYYIDDVSIVPVNSKPQSIITNNTATSAFKQNLSVGDKVVLKNISFNTNEITLTDNSYNELNHLLTFLKNNPSVIIEISGHTDNNGSEAHNKNLSLKRAQMVADFLINKGVVTERVKSVGYGSSKPIAENSTEYGKSQNRRVEFQILKK